jgi:hypothetical protein
MPKAKAKWHTREVELTVVGLIYRVTRPMLRTLNEQTPFRVECVREHDNVHDENAIAVEVAERTLGFEGKIGYLRRQVASVFAPAMDAGELEISDGWITVIDTEAGQADVRLTFRSKKSLQIHT